MDRVMRRKSNFAPSDSKEEEDERCTGLHSNDIIEAGVCVCVCCACKDARRLPACLLFDSIWSALW